MKHWITFLIIIACMYLTSCSLLWGKQDVQNTEEKIKIQNETEGILTWIQYAEKITTRNTEEVGKPGISSWVLYIIPETNNSTWWVDNTGWEWIHSVTFESLDKVSSHEEFIRINPLMVSEFPGNNTSEYLEFQKDQMKLWLLISQIQDQKYIKLREEQKEIQEGKEIWTTKVKKADAQLQDALKHAEEVSFETMRLLSTKRAQAISEFQTSMEYMWYIEKNRDKLSSISESMVQYYTPEIIALQEKIKTYISANAWVMAKIQGEKNN